MKKQNKVSIREVAKHAGVSVASVSYALNNVNKVSEATRRRIMRSIEILDYAPNMSARGLSSGKSRIIGVAFPITEDSVAASDIIGQNPFFGEFLSGLEQGIEGKDYDIMLSAVHVRGAYKNWAKRRYMDGMVFIGAFPEAIHEELKGLDIPIVLTDVYEPYAKDFHCIRTDDELGSYMATRDLIEQGHEKIAFATGELETSPLNAVRFEGYKKALKEANIPLDETLVIEEKVNYAGGAEAAKRIMRSKQPITAVHAVGDIMAVGLIKTLQEHGKKVPEDYSVIGFDDIKIGEFITPGLSTIHQKIREKGRLAAQYLIDDIEEKLTSKADIILEPSLVRRASAKGVGISHETK